MTAGDLERAFDFVVRADMAGTRTESFRFGTLVRMPECPLRHDSNYLLVTNPDGADAAALAAEADRLLGGAGLAHRLVMFRDAAAGERLAGEFQALGWTLDRGVVMAQRRRPERAVDLSQVLETSDTQLRVARRAQLLNEPWCTPETADQILDARRHIPVVARHFAVWLDARPASWCELYLEDGTAQVEAVATVERHRNRGLASAVVLRAVAEARAAGADLVFLVASADDWPRHLYRRLGFDEIGEYVKFRRTVSPVTDHGPQRHRATEKSS